MRFARALLLLAAVRAASAADSSTPEIAELEKKIAAAAPAARIALTIDLAERLETIDPVRGLKLAEEAREAATSARDKLSALAVLASLRRQQTDYAEALRLAKEGLAEAAKLGDDRARARFLYLIARTHWSLADHPASIASFHEAIFLGEKTGDLALLSDAHTGIVTIYTELKDYPKSEFHLVQAKKTAEELGDQRRLGDYYKVLGNHRDNVGDRPAARAAHTRSMEIHERAGNERGVADALQNVGHIVELGGDFAGARERYLRAIAIYERLGLKRHLANATRLLGRVLVKEGEFPAGIAQLERSLALARDFGGAVTVTNAYSQLAVAHEAAGNLPVALDFQRKLQAATAAIFTEKTRQQVTLLNAQFESERRRHEIELLRRDQSLRAAELRARDAELERARAVRWGLIGGATAGAVALGAVVLALRTRLRSEREQLEETRRARAAAEEANTLKIQLLGIASRDLKAPLRAMLVRAEQLQPALAGSPVGAAALAHLRSDGERMLGIVHDLIDVSAIEADELRLQFAPVDLGALTLDVVRGLQELAQLKSLALVCAVPPAPAWVRGDHRRLQQVITNLVDNAVKFSSPGKTVTVGVSAGKGDVVVRVRDEGPGIAAGDLARMFQPFQTLSAVPTGGESSSGLGLHICREIVARHGGRVEVDTAPWKGATFSVVLPAVPEGVPFRPVADPVV